MVGRAAVLAALGTGALLGWPRLPPAAPVDAPPDAFSAGRALAHVRAWATEPRPSGSDVHARVLGGVERALADAGLEVRREPFVARVPMTNLVAGPPGAADGAGVWLVTHSDSVRAGPGAADAAMGLAVVVEAARALSVGGVPPDLRVLVTDGEELGLLGAVAHTRAAGPGARVALNVEARGTEGPAYMFQTAGDGGALLGAWREARCGAQATSLARGVYETLPNDTDFTVLRAAGWAGYDFALIGGAWRYHTPDDTPDHLDPRSVQQVGDCVLGLARAWLGRPAAARAEAATGDAAPVYAQLGGTTAVLPPVAVQVAGGLLLLGAGWGRGLLRGVLGWLLAAGLSVAAGLGAGWALPRLRPDFWDRPAEMVDPHAAWLGIALAGALAAALGLLVAVRVPRRGDPLPGWTFAGALLAGGLAVAVPTVGYVLLPGALAGVLLRRGRWGWALVPAALAGMVLTPLALALSPALTSRAAPVLALVPLLLFGWVAAYSTNAYRSVSQ